MTSTPKLPAQQIVPIQPIDPNHFTIIEGSTDILLIAPHACIRNGEPKDDENTGPITELVARQIGCSAIINTYFHKPDGEEYPEGYKPKKNEYPHGLNYGNLNLNVIADAEQVPGYLDAIRAVVDSPGKTTVIWVHGADTDNAIEVASNGTYQFQPAEIEAFIGHGQGSNPDSGKGKSRFTAESSTVERFRDALIANGMNAVIADDKASNYRGRSLKLMNQWFLKNKYSLEQVESIQLEIRKEGFRDLFENIEKSANILAGALSLGALVPVIQEETEADDQLVDLAFNHLRGIFANHFHEAMLHAGRYLVRTFYGSFENARNKAKIRKQSFEKLAERLDQGSGDAPKKTWIYDAVKLAVDDHYFRMEGGQIFRAYGKLGHSHKVRLAHVQQPEIKERLIQEIAHQEEPVSDKDLRARIAEEKAALPKKKRKLTIAQAIKDPRKLATLEATEARSFVNISNLENKEIKRLYEYHNETVQKINEEIMKRKREIESYENDLNNYKVMEWRIGAVETWHKELKKRESGEKKIELPEETPRLKKLRDAVQFMIFWKGLDYANHCIFTRRTYIPFEEASESQLEAFLYKGQCHLQATYDFEVTKHGKVKWLSRKQVQNRLAKETFWLSRKKYELLSHSDYFEYK
jgi:hypothetical protein